MSKLSKCKNCTGELKYDAESQMLKCLWCGSKFPVQEKRNFELRRKYDSSYSPNENSDSEIGYKCSTCGTKLMAGTDSEIYRCSSCGNSTLVKEKSVLNVPDGILPFEISRDKAARIFREWVGQRKFAPSDLKQMAKLEKISGIYTPIWNFSYSSAYRYSLVGIKKTLDSYYNEVRNEYYIQKVIEDKCENRIYSANLRMEKEMDYQFEDYDFQKIKTFSTDYILGFTAFDTDIDIHKIYNSIEKEVKKENDEKILIKLEEEYDYIEDFSSVVKLKNVNFNYLYVPVWANHYTYKGKQYHCYINGQTGKAMGGSPKSVGKIAGTVLGILGGIGAILLIIAGLI